MLTRYYNTISESRKEYKTSLNDFSGEKIIGLYDISRIYHNIKFKNIYTISTNLYNIRLSRPSSPVHTRKLRINIKPIHIISVFNITKKIYPLSYK